MKYPKFTPRNSFAFQFKKTTNLNYQKSNFIEPWVAGKSSAFDGTYESLKKGTYACSKDVNKPNYCTKWLELNNWKITDDYPW